MIANIYNHIPPHHRLNHKKVHIQTSVGLVYSRRSWREQHHWVQLYYVCGSGSTLADEGYWYKTHITCCTILIVIRSQVAGTPKPAGFGRSSHAATVAMTMLAMFVARAAAVQPHVVLKAPRVYNALITSDQQLLPSRADPIVEPVLRPFQYFYDWPGVYAAAAAGQRTVLSARPAGALDVIAGARADEPARPEDDDGRPTAVIKNNRPADSSVPDVPPPPLPVSRAGRKDNKKKPEEFPPAPVGFAMWNLLPRPRLPVAARTTHPVACYACRPSSIPTRSYPLLSPLTIRRRLHLIT